MHIVREQRLSAGGVASVDDPVVRARRAALASWQPEQREQGARISIETREIRRHGTCV